MTYRVEISFGGFIGCSNIYEVEAESIEEAQEIAMEEAQADLSIEQIDED